MLHSFIKSSQIPLWHPKHNTRTIYMKSENAAPQSLLAVLMLKDFCGCKSCATMNAQKNISVVFSVKLFTNKTFSLLNTCAEALGSAQMCIVWCCTWHSFGYSRPSTSRLQGQERPSDFIACPIIKKAIFGSTAAVSELVWFQTHPVLFLHYFPLN